MPHFVSYSSDVEMFAANSEYIIWVRIEIERCLNSKKAPLGRFFHWWVVQDYSAIASPFGSSPQPLRCFAAQNSNLLGFESLSIADSKKAPLGRFFTLVGRAG